ncbi:clumping factor A-like [Leptopilina boulardi]|uniref:clumping factor A-like n=1 Tax=Leptopilina boulardi TaxID=63433 RepID=UPI0021F52653|nr:clumping factor A-like [Leptopilina boulardi]
MATYECEKDNSSSDSDENQDSSSQSSEFQSENDVTTESSIDSETTSARNSSPSTVDQDLNDSDAPVEQPSPLRSFSFEPLLSPSESSTLTIDNNDNNDDGNDSGSDDNVSIGNASSDNGRDANDSSDNDRNDNVSAGNGSDDNSTSDNDTNHNDNSDSVRDDNGSDDNNSSDNDRDDNDTSDSERDDNGSSDNDVDNGNDNEIRWFDNPIYQNADICGGEALNQILKVYVSNRLTKKALGDILNLMHSLLPNDHTLPTTKYQLFKLIDDILPQEADYTTKHRICSDCLNLVGEWTDTLDVQIYPRCNEYRRLKTIAIPGQYDFFLI